MDGASARRAAADIFAGGGLGLLLGVVVGLTTSPVAAIVVGALTSLLAVFLGLDGSEAAERAGVRANALRIGSLGLATVAGVGIGLYVRINNPLAVAPATQLAAWTSAFPNDPTLAKQMMVFERTGIAPSAFTYGQAAPTAPVDVTVQENVAVAKSAVLFSSLAGFDACGRLDPARFSDPAGVLFEYRRANTPELVKRAGARIETFDPADRPLALATAHQILCLVQEAEREDE